MLENVRIVLVEPSHGGNIGAAARAMKNMGLCKLYLVKPKQFPHRNATIRASGADDLLQNAVVTETLSEALEGCVLTYGTSARLRSLPWPLCNPRECAADILQQLPNEAAIVFGREDAGLTNEELALCQRHVNIPTEAEFSSLNLGSAVQVLTYELKMGTVSAPIRQKNDSEFATAEQVEGFYEHLQSTMVNIGFLDMRSPKLLMQRMRRLFNRARLEKTELNILRGLLSTVDRKL